MNRPATAVAGLYAIADTAVVPAARLQPAVIGAIAGGAALIQYRDKGGDTRQRHDQAAALVRLCAARGVPLIVNDDVGLAREVDAAGVHLGRDDMPLLDARRILGPGAIIGVSCYNNLEAAVQAAAQGADYVAFGAMYPSSTKPGAAPAGVDLLRRVRTRLRCPIVAIGGITPDNARALLEAGADAVAVIGALFSAADIEAAARRFAALFHTP